MMTETAPLPRFDLIIFDVDGTLMDSLAGIVLAMDAAWRALGLPGSVGEEEVARVVGLSLPQAAAVLLPGGDPGQWQALVLGYKEHFRRLADAGMIQAPLFPGVRETLDHLRQQGVALALATGKSMAGVGRNLRDHELEGYFQVVKTADCAPSKPDPEMLQQILMETGVPPGRALMVGDTEYDLEMGQRAGVATCAVAFGCHAPERLRQMGPDYWLEEMGELVAVVFGP